MIIIVLLVASAASSQLATISGQLATIALLIVSRFVRPKHNSGIGTTAKTTGPIYFFFSMRDHFE